MTRLRVTRLAVAFLTAVLTGLALAPAASALPLPAWRIVPTGSPQQFRGLAAVSAQVAWLAGTAATVLRTVDGGAHWQNVSPPGLPTDLQFRDIEAWDARHAVALTIGNGPDSRIYRTSDGGQHWTEAYQNPDPNAFYDCMAFFDRSSGLALSDPVGGRFRILRTSDGGAHWAVQDPAGMPPALDGEFAFAASGTCLVTGGPHNAWIASGGGATARVFRSTDSGRTWTVADTPVASGPAAGIFSLAVRSTFALVAVGGDFLAPTGRTRIAATSGDGGIRWTSVRSMPFGYRSAAAWVPGSVASVVAVGPTGSDVSLDAGWSWRTFDVGSFDNVQCARDGACWASGSNGRVGVLTGRL
jgi:photosystem II stability/assembly factor-like uncharacterized protein